MKDAPHCGGGQRLVIALDPGRNNVTLCSPTILARVRVTRAELAGATALDLEPLRLESRPEKKPRLFKRRGLTYDR